MAKAAVRAKKSEHAEYDKAVASVEELAAMTSSRAWGSLYRWMNQEIVRHADAVLNAEKSRDVVHHQEGVKIIRHVLEHVQEPIAALDALIATEPMFLPANHKRGWWDEETGSALLLSKDDPRFGKRAKKKAVAAEAPAVPAGDEGAETQDGLDEEDGLGGEDVK